MTDMDQILSEFAEAWKRGERPDVAAYLERVPPRSRSLFATLIDHWLTIAPTPAYDEATRAQIAAEPLLQEALGEVELMTQPVPERLQRLRKRAGLEVADVAREVAQTFGLSKPDAARAERYLEQLEAGDLDDSRLSRRLTDALAQAFGAAAGALGPAPSWAPAASVASGPLFRADGTPDPEVAEAFEILARAAATPATEPLDEVDRLFLGGPGG